MADLPQDLSPGTRTVVELVGRKRLETRHDEVHVRHWLAAVLERHGPMVESLAHGVEARGLRLSLYQSLGRGEVGDPLPLEAVLGEARKLTAAEGRSLVSERDIAVVVLRSAGYEPKIEAAIPLPRVAQPPTQAAEAPPTRTVPTPVATPAAAEAASPAPAGAEGAARTFTARARRPTPMLEQLGLDLTQQALDGKLGPVIGREDETELVIETLCRRTKRNPVLVGPAGVGKTAIVEGLARRIAEGRVPELLRDTRLFSLQPSSLVSGSGIVGELEKRMTAVIAEASQDGILLFIDEVHSMIGAGGRSGSSDMASLLKPALARGGLACIAATTDEEYRRFVEEDSALERRFQPVRVQELSPDETMAVLRALRDALTKLRGVRLEDGVLRRLVDLAASHMKNRYFPDKAVDLLEQCVAWAVANGRAEVTPGDAEAIVQRTVGMPVAPAARVKTLVQALREGALLEEADLEALGSRLQVTLRGLDVRHLRPNAVVLLGGKARGISEALAETLAASLFGSGDRVVSIDFARFTHHTDVTLLLGAPPGYVGYSDNLPLHRLLQMPWCVVECENVDDCHPQVRAILVQALAEGFFTESRGKRIYLSDTVVILTAGSGEEEGAARRPMGFGDAAAAPRAEHRHAFQETLGSELLSQCDVVITSVPERSAAPERVRALLLDLADRYRPRGLELTWDDSVVAWLASGERAAAAGAREWERLVDHRISAALVPHLVDEGAGAAATLRLSYAEGTLSAVAIMKAADAAGGAADAAAVMKAADAAGGAADAAVTKATDAAAMPRAPES